MELILAPNEILTQKCAPVTKITTEIKKQCNEMLAFMQLKNAIGLSAPQVGLTNRVFVMDTFKLDKVNGYKGACVNPILLKRNLVRRETEEGCLSFKDKKIRVKRPTEITVKFKDEKGKLQFKVLKGITAICWLHEFDHLNGVLMDSYQKVSN